MAKNEQREKQQMLYRRIKAQEQQLAAIEHRNGLLAERVKMLEERNRFLRDEVERLTHGAQADWTPFERCNMSISGDGRVLPDTGKDQLGHECRVFLNSRYQVAVYAPTSMIGSDGKLYHLSIKRRDGAACRDWRDFQRIKNELIGPEAEAVELYPAESRLVDGANQYHLWALEGQKFFMGFHGKRLVSEDNSRGVQQRPFDADQKPSDLQTLDEIVAASGVEINLVDAEG